MMHFTSKPVRQQDLNALLSMIQVAMEDVVAATPTGMYPEIATVRQCVYAAVVSLGLTSQFNPVDIDHLAEAWSNQHKARQSLPPAKDPTTQPGYIPMNTFPFFREIVIKGQHFLPASGKALIPLLAPGDEFMLVAEPTNEHDCYAVAALFNGERVGYVQKEVSSAVAWLLTIQMPLKTTLVSVGKGGNLIVNVVELKP